MLYPADLSAWFSDAFVADPTIVFVSVPWSEHVQRGNSPNFGHGSCCFLPAAHSKHHPGAQSRQRRCALLQFTADTMDVSVFCRYAQQHCLDLVQRLEESVDRLRAPQDITGVLETSAPRQYLPLLL